MIAVEVQDVAKVYRTGLRRQTVRALDGVGLTVEPGEVFGLLGPNGAGKTTLVKVLLGIVRPTRGHAAILGLPVERPEARWPVGYLPENHRFPDFLTAGQVMDVYGRLAGVDDGARRQRIPDLLERVGMGRWRDVKVKKFSKGMMQRLGLAQALLNEPRLLFLDEPTDGVDPLGRRDIRDLLLWLRERGTTIFLNSHLLSEVEQVCSRVAIMNAGRLVRTGTIDALTARARTYEVVCTPLPDDLLQTHRSTLTTQDVPGASDLSHYHAVVDDRAALNALLDHLRGRGVELESVRPVRQSLEDYFIDVVGQEGSDGAGGALTGASRP